MSRISVCDKHLGFGWGCTETLAVEYQGMPCPICRAESAEAELAALRACEWEAQFRESEAEVERMQEALRHIAFVHYRSEHGLDCECLNCWTWARATAAHDGAAGRGEG